MKLLPAEGAKGPGQGSGADRPVGEIVFLDFEASSLGKKGFPIEVAWVFASGEEEGHLIRPAPDWTEWAADAEAVHRISRDRLAEQGEPHDAVARRMVEVLSGHRLFATAPSWDGQWMSRLLRAAGLPRHALRLQDTDLAHREAIGAVLSAAQVPAECHDGLATDLLAELRRRDEANGPPAHRALDDARHEMQLLHEVRRRAQAAACV